MHVLAFVIFPKFFINKTRLKKFQLRYAAIRYGILWCMNGTMSGKIPI